DHAQAQEAGPGPAEGDQEERRQRRRPGRWAESRQWRGRPQSVQARRYSSGQVSANVSVSVNVRVSVRRRRSAYAYACAYAYVLLFLVAHASAQPAPERKDAGFIDEDVPVLEIDDCPAVQQMTADKRAEIGSEHFERGLVLYTQGDY